MAEKKENIFITLEQLQGLRGFLKSEMSVGNPEEGRIKAEIKVYNDAPVSSDGSEVVFLGVGLLIIDGRERAHTNWTSRVRLPSKPDQSSEVRQKYNKGVFVIGGSGVGFPAVTSDENSHGQALFPGESLVFEIDISEDQLPYLEIRVEGSVSRRHLLHISRPMKTMEKWSQPRVLQTFQDLDKIDLYTPLVSLIDAIPAFSPQTTLADIDVFREEIEKVIKHVKITMPELNKVYHAAPNQELRDLMKQHIGKYLTTSERICQGVLKTLSSSDIGHMKASAEELKTHLLTLEEVKRAKADSMSQFGIEPS